MLLDAFDFRAQDKDRTKKVVDEVDERIAALNSERYSLSQNRKKVQASLQEDQILFSPDEAQRLFGEAGVLFQAWYDGVQQRGKAQPGEKTFLDGMAPVLAALLAGEEPLTAARNALLQAQQGVQQTTTMVAKHGRAAIHGERSRTFVDPGAMVAQLLIQGYFNFVQAICPSDGR